MTTLSEFLNSMNLKIGNAQHIRFTTNSLITYLKLRDEEAQDYYIDSVHLMSAENTPYVKLELVAVSDPTITKDKYMSLVEAEDLPITITENIFVGEEINGDGKLIACYVNKDNINLRNQLRDDKKDKKS